MSWGKAEFALPIFPQRLFGPRRQWRIIPTTCPNPAEFSNAPIVIHLDRPLDYIMPMVMDLVNGQETGLNFRHEKQGELIAEIHQASSLLPEDPDNYNDQCEEESKARLAELLLDRLPDLPRACLGRGWAGLYPVSVDHRPLVGPVDPSEPSLVTAAGAGGYGIQLGPVIGQLAADWALHGAPVSAPGTEILAPTTGRNAPPAMGSNRHAQ